MVKSDFHSSQINLRREFINDEPTQDKIEYKFDTPILTIFGEQDRIEPSNNKEFSIQYDKPSNILISEIMKNNSPSLSQRLSSLSSHKKHSHHHKKHFPHHKKYSLRHTKHHTLPTTKMSSIHNKSSKPISYTPPKSLSIKSIFLNNKNNNSLKKNK